MLSRRAACTLLVAAPLGHAADAVAQTEPAAALKGGRWEWRDLNGAPAGKGRGGAAPWLQFDPPGFSGFAGCNRVMGGISVDDRRFAFSPDMAVTKMFCAEHMAVERQFLAALRQVREWRLAGGELALIGRASVLVFARAAAEEKRP
jgi:heat shock protein HslJ